MEKLLITEDLSKNFVKGGKTIKAVEKVNLALDYGQTIGLVGESGCGKSTTGRLILDLITPSEGKVYFEGKNIYELDKNEKLSFRRNAQIIFQDCFASLSPRAIPQGHRHALRRSSFLRPVRPSAVPDRSPHSKAR